jgi:hypothetical protein
MFVIHFPTTFPVGDTVDCRINGKAERVTYRDENTLVIEPDDARKIMQMSYAGPDGNDVPVSGFICSDAEY